MPKSANLVFFGNERLSSGFSPAGAPTLQALLDAGYTVSAVVVNQQSSVSRKARELEVEQVARVHNIPVLAPANLADMYSRLVAIQAPIAVLVAYGKIIPQSIINIFPKGILNIHPSLLPLYRGSTPIEQAILDGAPQTGVSIMKLVRAMDAGPIFAQTKLTLTGKETKQELTNQLLQRGGELLIRILPSVLDSSAIPWPQDDTKATFTPQLAKINGILDTQKSALLLEREVRAYAGWPKSKLNIFGQDIIVLQARTTTGQQDEALVLACSPGFLEIQKLIAPSGRTMTGPEFIRGYKK